MGRALLDFQNFLNLFGYCQIALDPFDDPKIWIQTYLTVKIQLYTLESKYYLRYI